ncbi:uncharacterized protein DUF2797 [Marinobacter persicus]|uniref:Uncharacterized protein DUF2797 n=2 Tax=Marinobacter persicus TaxID=930118 RepID=A0A2S6G2Y0_9GAMM|nr:DUF2797 domain-containing protein [Marinobacter persicus]PPK50167.1 uncharacterized protein DUF2797 [Marinobacter persicus]PPK52626.1 uncharacterized protein DUF2797 [Marinobacter persicus]PPK56655.1 uncharacterized protein DUF2797 [Marinobacter persicus]
MSELIDVTGRLRKMPASAEAPVSYQLAVGDARINVNELVGRRVRLDFDGVIRCIHCDRTTKKSFNQGYCYPCFRKLAACDSCIMSPEKCHFHLGTCREPEWGERNCMVEHVVYLANSSGLKVGITRGTQVPTRWIDQGAVDAIPMLRVSTRYLAGLAEVACKQHVADRTNWRAMLKGEVPELDLEAERERILGLIGDDLAQLRQEHGEDSLRVVEESPQALSYPVEVWPSKVKTHNLDKTPDVEGLLEGIKGQYLILDTGVINIRKFTGYEVRFRVLD